MEEKNKELESVNAKAARAIDEANDKAKKQIEKKHEETDMKIETAEKKAGQGQASAKPAPAEHNEQIQSIKNDIKSI